MDHSAPHPMTGEPWQSARAAIAALGEPASSLLMAAHGLDGLSHAHALDVIARTSIEVSAARSIVHSATVALARGPARPAFEVLLTHYAGERASGREVRDPWHSLAVLLTHGSISRWSR